MNDTNKTENNRFPMVEFSASGKIDTVPKSCSRSLETFLYRHRAAIGSQTRPESKPAVFVRIFSRTSLRSDPELKKGLKKNDYGTHHNSSQLRDASCRYVSDQSRDVCSRQRFSILTGAESPHGGYQPRRGWAPDPPMVGIRSRRSPIGLVAGSCTRHPGVLGSIPKREEPGKTGEPCVNVQGW